MSTWPIQRIEPVCTATPQFRADVRAGLGRAGQKSLPPKYLYDELGSLLFDAITRLPEYGVWRAERRLLVQHAAEIAELSGADLVVELGSGSASKTRSVLEALLQHGPVTYCAVHGIARDYLPGLEEALRGRAPGKRALILFLGSSLGNFDYVAGVRFLHSIQRSLRSGDSLLLGTDLEKPEEQLIAAYDDALGVTAAFDLNLLVRMNRELDANFVLSRFRHRARYDPQRRNVEMHIESSCAQKIDIPGAGMSLEMLGGETIHTENSHKYSAREIEESAIVSGFARLRQWCDEEWPFASNLLVVP
jgi:L-histidine N-alpha-methyltransferase